MGTLGLADMRNSPEVCQAGDCLALNETLGNGLGGGTLRSGDCPCTEEESVTGSAVVGKGDVEADRGGGTEVLGGGSGRVCGSSLVGQVEQPRLPPSSRGGAGGSLKDCNRKYKVPVHYPPLSTRLFSHSVDSSTEDHP